MENAFYFPHDYDAADDDKMLVLFARYGEDECKAYGAFWRLIEALARKSDTALPFFSLEGLAPKMRVSHEWLKQFVETCIDICLFADNGNGGFTSSRLLKHKDKREEGRQKRQAAGRKGGLAKAANESNVLAGCSNAIAMPEQSVANSTRGKNRIVKERIEEESIYMEGANAHISPFSFSVKQGETNKGFVPPTVDQVAAYLEELDVPNSQPNALRFVSAYEAKGWALGRGTTVRDWKAQVRNWISNEYFDLY